MTGGRLGAGFLIVGMLLLVTPAQGDVLARIAQTGVIHAGTRDHIPPFAARRGDGHLAGFSVEVIEAVRAAAAAELDRDVTIDLVQVDAQSRIDAVEGGDLDITCDIASPTWEREQRIDFSLTIFFSGTRILMHREAAREGLDGLERPRIGVVTASSTIGVIEDALPAAKVVEFSDMIAAFAALEAGQVDGISNIGVLLRKLQQAAAQPGAYVVLPRSGYLNAEPMACVLPEDDSDWHDHVNHTIAGMLEGIEDYRGAYYDAYRRWFGPEADLHYPLSREAIDHFNEVRIWLR